MPDSSMTKIGEMFGTRSDASAVNWIRTIEEQWCPHLTSKCIKIRKSQPDLAIGTCTVRQGRQAQEMVICPHRFMAGTQVLADCLHLLAPLGSSGELHAVPEVAIPGGNVDYILARVRRDRVHDCVGLELQALDTTGTVWPERQREIWSEVLGDNYSSRSTTTRIPDPDAAFGGR